MPGWEHTGSSGAFLGAKSSEHAHALVIGKCIKVERGGERGRGGIGAAVYGIKADYMCSTEHCVTPSP